MLKDGIPIIYQGQEQHYAGAGVPHNREALWLSGYPTTSELYGWIAKLNAIRTWAISRDPSYLSYHAHATYSDSNAIVVRKGHGNFQTIAIFTNAGAASATTTHTMASSATGFTAGQTLVDVLSCSLSTADASTGSVTVTLVGGLPRVLYPLNGLSGSGICPTLTGPSSTTTTVMPPPSSSSSSLSSLSSVSSLPISTTTSE